MFEITATKNAHDMVELHRLLAFTQILKLSVCVCNEIVPLYIFEGKTL